MQIKKLKEFRASALIAFTVLAAVGLIACGGSSDSDDSTTSENKGSAKTALAPPPTSPPTEMDVREPLPEAPEKGKKVIFLQCELPTCESFAEGISEAADALGWKAENQVFKAADPGTALSQAIQRRPDFIAITGIPYPLIKPQLKAAADAGIPVASCGTTDKPAPNGYLVECQGTFRRHAEYLGRWIANDSDGKASVVGVTIPEFESLNTMTDWFNEEFAKQCDGCGYKQLDLTIEDLATGSASQKIIAYLQSNPDVDYVFASFSDPVNELPTALKSVGREGTKIVVAAGTPSITQRIGKDFAAQTFQPFNYNSWLMMDALARVSTGVELTPDHQDAIYDGDTWVADSSEAVESLQEYEYTWPGPGFPPGPGYKQGFEELWQVAG